MKQLNPYKKNTRRGSMMMVSAFTSILMIMAAGYQLRANKEDHALSRAHGLAVIISDLASDYDFFISKIGQQAPPGINNFNKIPTNHFTDFTSNYWRFKNSNICCANPMNLKGVDLTLGYGLGENNNAMTAVVLIKLQAGEKERLLSDLKNALQIRESRNKISEIHYSQNTNRVFYLNTPKHSGLDPHILLRTKRSGHDVGNSMETNLSLLNKNNNNNILRIENIKSQNLEIINCNIALSDCVKSNQIKILKDSAANALSISGNLEVVENGTIQELTAPNIKAQSAAIITMKALNSVNASGDTNVKSLTGLNLTANGIIATNPTSNGIISPNGTINEAKFDKATAPLINPKSLTTTNILSKGGSFTRVTTRGCVGC